MYPWGKYVKLSNDIADYSADYIFANFREVTGGNLKENILYRGSSPADNIYNRASTCDLLLEKAGISLVLDLADDEEKFEKHMLSDDFDSPYLMSLYDSENVILVGLSARYRNEDYAEELVEALNQMTEYEGPYYVHCTLGFDRTGFVCILLESIAGSSYDEIEKDYMLSYADFYNVTKESDPAKYEAIKEAKFEDIVFWLYDIADESEISGVDLEECAKDYLMDGGMSEEEYQKLKKTLVVE